MIVIYVCAILISLFSFFASFSYQLYASSWLQAAELCSFSEKALRNYTLTPRPPPSLQDPRPRISIDLGRYAFAYTCIYRIAGFFRGRKLSRISRFCGDLRKLSSRKSILKQLDTALVGVVHVTANSRKFSLRKCIFKQFAKVFSREKTRYTVYLCMRNVQCCVQLINLLLLILLNYATKMPIMLALFQAIL